MPASHAWHLCYGDNLTLDFHDLGAVAQLGERLNRIQEVVGSIPSSSISASASPCCQHPHSRLVSMKRLVLLCCVLSCLLCPFRAARAASAQEQFEEYGDVAQILIPAMVFSFVLLADREAAVPFLKTYGSALATTYAGKYAFDNVASGESTLGERPDGARLNFPSGHTTSAFAGASFVAYRYGWLEAIPFFLAASLVGYSRVVADKHTASGVLAGAAVGLLNAALFTTNRRDDHFRPEVFVFVNAAPENERVAITLTWRF